MPLRGKRKASTLGGTSAEPPIEAVTPIRRRGKNPAPASTDPNQNKDIEDGQSALRASPDATGPDEKTSIVSTINGASARKKGGAKKGVGTTTDSLLNGIKDHVTAEPEGNESLGNDGNEPASEAEVQDALARPPPVNSDYLPLPWKGRLGYACLNTYLRSSNPPVFSSRTCRIQSILDHRHPLKNPDEPEHPTKNRPDKDRPAEVWRGQKYVEALGLANARDIVKMIRWNDKYGIKFMRLSSEMFPFASHEEYGYKLAPFAAETLREAGRVAGELGHRLTTHPGQFTQLGSPRKEVIRNAVRDLEYHAEMLGLLRLPPQQDRDAVMILHMGGMFGDKKETLDRFRTNYATLSESVKKRLVLENDDMCWSVHDLLPICEELNIPFVLDFHHHNIVFDSSKIREGTKDIMDLYPRILKTWERKGITPKMHYSEQTAAAITPRQRRKHSPRVATLPPCPPTMDLMIEAKDKEQAVFELMRAFKLPGYDLFSDIIPFVRDDETRLAKPYTKKELKERDAAEVRGEMLTDRKDVIVPEEEVGMGGSLGRVYWPPTMEEWLRPEKVLPKEKSTKTSPKVVKAEVNGAVNAEVPSMEPPKSKTPLPAAKSRKVLSKGRIVKQEQQSNEYAELSEEMPDQLAEEAPKRSHAGRKNARAKPERPVQTPKPGRPGRRGARVSYSEEDASD